MIRVGLSRPDLCRRCGHKKSIHKHYTGTWCSKCPGCNRFKPMPFVITWGWR